MLNLSLVPRKIEPEINSYKISRKILKHIETHDVEWAMIINILVFCCAKTYTVMRVNSAVLIWALHNLFI